MATPIPLPPADKRAPYDRTITFIGPDWSGEAFLVQFRNLPGDQGAPLFELETASSGEGVSATFDPAFPVPRTDVTAPATHVRFRINETTLEGLNYGTPTEQPIDAHWDMHVGTGAAKRVHGRGILKIDPGVTL